jgi:outer membrane murein-binding lipoprotein Lpp
MTTVWRAVFAACIACVLLVCPVALQAQIIPASYNVKDFGAKGDGVADDTQAIKDAFAAAQKTAISAPTPGTAYHFSLSNVYFPNGRYLLSEPLQPSANMIGEGNPILQQPDPTKDIIGTEWVWRWKISGFTFLGGKNSLHIGNPNLDSGRIIIDNCNFYNAADAAVRLREGSNSTQVTMTNCVVLNCNQAFVNWCDMARVADTWVSTSPNMKDLAVFENHGCLLLEHVLGVPQVTPGNDQRWIDNYGGVTCRNVRFGGEGAGFTPVVNWAAYDYTYPVIPSYVVIDACNIYGLGNPNRKAIVYCEEVPNQIIITNNNGMPDLPMLGLSEKLDLNTYFDNAKQRGDMCLRFLIGPEQVEVGNRDLPEQMRPYQANEILGDGPPTTGNWRRGAFIRNKNLEGRWTAQGYVKTTTPALQEPYGWYCTESGKPGTWQAVRFVIPQ